MSSMLNQNRHLNILQYILPHFPNYYYSTRGVDNFVFPYPNVDTDEISFMYQFIKIWNDVPAEIKNATSFCVFKNLHHQHLMHKYCT